jgi:ATP-binding cassette subfamily E protein 1
LDSAETDEHAVTYACINIAKLLYLSLRAGLKLTSTGSAARFAVRGRIPMRKCAHIDFQICDPAKHDPEKGICTAAEACTHGLLEQEEPFEGPILMSASMCVGCGNCVTACPLGAIRVDRGV